LFVCLFCLPLLQGRLAGRLLPCTRDVARPRVLSFLAVER
jgi:hypothetical protein